MYFRFDVNTVLVKNIFKITFCDISSRLQTLLAATLPLPLPLR